MAQSLTQQVNGRSPVQRMARVAMPQPVSASLFRDARAFSSFLNQVRRRNPVQPAAIGYFPTPENWFRIPPGRSTVQNIPIQRRRQQNDAGFAALAVNQKLAAFSVRSQIFPVEPTKF